MTDVTGEVPPSLTCNMLYEHTISIISLSPGVPLTLVVKGISDNMVSYCRSV